MDDEVSELPLWYYQWQCDNRQNNGCTASIMGKVILNQATSFWKPTGTSSTSSATAGASSPPENAFVNDIEVSTSLSTSLVPQTVWYNQTIYLVVYGFSNGQIAVTEASTNSPIFDMTGASSSTFSIGDSTAFHAGNSISNTRETREGSLSPSWFVASNNVKPSAVAAVSMDASGTVISAIDTQGNCTIWTVKYSIQYLSDQSTDITATSDTRTESLKEQKSNAKVPPGNILSKLFWRKETAPVSPSVSSSIGISAPYNSSVASTDIPNQGSDLKSPKRTAVLTMVDVKVLRLQPYSSAIYGVPTCLCLDPYFQTNNKLLVGFTSGKIVLTSRNWIRRFDEHTIIPNSASLHDKDWIGVEALAWRGSVFAFADCSGVKLFDSISLKPIAHVDRPIGAQPSLYHWENGTDESLKEVHVSNAGKSWNGRIIPHLCFETSRSLLVAWGDCLLALSITHANSLVGDAHGAPEASASEGTVLPLSARNRNVVCTMAWALDGIVASDVVPIDRRHVAILGQVLLDDDYCNATSFDTATLNQRTIRNPYELELQILDRTNGSIVYSDMLQLQKDSSFVFPNISNPNFRLLSSFSVPRMDDSLELREEKGDSIVELSGVDFVDSHLKWDLNVVSFQESFQNYYDKPTDQLSHEDDIESVDSDDYHFVGKTALTSDTSAPTFHPPPVLLIVSDSDTVLARFRDLDDAIQFALDNRKPALALRWALASRGLCFRKYSLDDLICNCLRSLLRLQSNSTSLVAGLPAISSVRQISLRRMTLAAHALPFLLGGNIDMWKFWLSELEKIAGALFLVRKCIPVRDPKLPRVLYARILSKMLDEVDDMRQSANPDVTERLIFEAEGHVLNTLLAWGTTQSLHDHIKLYEYQSNLDSSYSALGFRTSESLQYRLQQSAVGFFDLTFLTSPNSMPTRSLLPIESNSHDANDSLYDIDDLFAELTRRSSIVDCESTDVSDLLAKLSVMQEGSLLTINAISKLFLMKGRHDDALKCMLAIGAMSSAITLEEIENDAVRFVNFEGFGINEVVGPYSFVLYIIDFYHLHQCLLETNFLPEVLKSSPVCALVRLVGLGLVGDFLISNCTAPQHLSSATSFPTAVQSGGERRGTLPIDLVAEQLKGSPKLFHWYLHLIFKMKPELYVHFPTTANPPPTVAELHKKHLELYLRFAGPNRNSAQVLAGIEAYLALEKSTPLLSFLKIVLPLGTVSPIEVGKMLEIERRGGAGVSHIFALELAYIMENYGSHNESDTQLVLELLLKGCQSLMLAVSFAQRASSHRLFLWEKLIEHCLLTSKSDKLSDGSISGAYFGSLLEAAALSGADLAHLVARIPKGMQVEGLRPRLVAAVADYRLKVQLHAKANKMAQDEVSLLRNESSRRLHQGVLFDSSADLDLIFSGPESSATNEADKISYDGIDDDLPKVLTIGSTLRPRIRPIRFSYSFTIPIR